MERETLKILCIGDPHYKENNISETIQMSNKLISLASRPDIDIVVNLGDTLHTHERIFENSLNRAISMMDAVSKIKPLYCLIGNHDRPHPQVYLTEEHPFNALKKWPQTTIVDKVVSSTIKGHKLIFVPYVYKGRFDEAIQTSPYYSQLKEVSCLFAHQEFRGCKMGASLSTDGDEWSEDKPLVVGGHIHDYQRIGQNIILTGTPIQHGYHDTMDKTVSVITLNPDKSWKEERIDLGLTKKQIVHLKVSDVKSFQPREDRIQKVVITGTRPDIQVLQKSDALNHLKEKVKISYRTIQNKKVTSKLSVPNRTFLTDLWDHISEDPLQKKAYQEVFN